MGNLSGKTNFFKKLGWTGLALCGLCCALPLVSGLIGISSLTVMAYYFEKISVIVLIIGIAFSVFLYFDKKQKTRACSTACEALCQCSTESLSKD